MYGSSFPNIFSPYFDIATVSVHALLHLSSFIPHVPEKRIMSKPMIWPEFRLHSALFSSRHIITTIVNLSQRIDTFRFENQILFRLLFSIFILNIISCLATIITDKFGSKELRTTNSMAYPDNVSEKQVKKTKKFYAVMQFGASFVSITESPTLTFWPLFAIEMAPLMMTLVRKGLISSLTYHRVYSFSLWINYPISIFMILISLLSYVIYENEILSVSLISYVLNTIIFTYFRFKNFNKHLLFTLLPFNNLLLHIINDTCYNSFLIVIKSLIIVVMINYSYKVIKKAFNWML